MAAPGSPAASSHSARRPLAPPQRCWRAVRPSSNSLAGRPSMVGARPGRKRIPTTSDPALIGASTGPVSGPATCREPSSQTMSMQPSGTIRWIIGRSPGSTRCVQTQATWRRRAAAGARSW
jgi:hypothetical protein